MLIEWNRFLISKVSSSLQEEFGCEKDTEIYKAKRYFYNKNNKKEILIYSELYFIGEFGLAEQAITDQMGTQITLFEFIEQVLHISVKQADRVITMIEADQIIHAEMKCGFHHPLIFIRQKIKNKSGIVCIEHVYVNTRYCELSEDTLPVNLI